MSTALVTGASSGLGEQFARVLAAMGFSLVLVAHRRSKLEALVSALNQRHSVRVDVWPEDLCDPEGPARIESRLVRSGQVLDLLVNNAGIG